MIKIAKSQTHTVQLTDDELLLLDGRCRPVVQDAVNAARSRVEMRQKTDLLAPALAGLVADAVREATQQGVLIWRWTSSNFCPLCQRSAGYAKWKRGPRKGRDRFDKPLVMQCVELAYRVVTIRGHVSLGGCKECVTEALPHLQRELSAVRAELSSELRAPNGPDWQRHDNRKCLGCGWEGHDGEMRRLRVLVGFGTYAGGCPRCPMENKPFGTTNIVARDGFTITERMPVLPPHCSRCVPGVMLEPHQRCLGGVHCGCRDPWCLKQRASKSRDEGERA